MGVPSVFAVVLSYNGSADTVECLQSLIDQDCPGLSVLVVDNASTDGAPGVIRARFPQIELLTLDRNRGWAGGNNLGIGVALDRGADVICLLNNDLVLPGDALRRLACAYRQLGSCLLHPAIYYYTDRNLPQLDPTVNSPAAERLAISSGDDVWSLADAYGACLMVGSEVFRKVGLFDERFFLQLEETDFCLRTRRQGLRPLCLPSVRVLHKESVAFGGRRSPMKTYYSVRNRLLLAEKHTPPGFPGSLAAARALYWQLRGLYGHVGDGGFLRWLLSADVYAVAVRRGILDYMARRFGDADVRTVRALESADRRSIAKEKSLLDL